MTFLYSSVHSECFSYIDYVFDEGTSCEACNNETEVTVINPVLIMVDWAIDDVCREHFFSFYLESNV